MLGAAGAIALAPAGPAAAAPPVVDFPQAGELVAGNDFTVLGTSDENFPIDVWMNAGPVQCTIPAQPGVWDWSCDITGLSGGAQTLHVLQNGIQVDVPFTLEGAPLVVTFPFDQQNVYGPVVEFRGTADTGDSVFVEVDGAPWCATGAPATPGGAWSCTGAPIVVTGPHTYEVVQGIDTVVGEFVFNEALPAPTTNAPGGIVERGPGDMPGGLLTVDGTGEYYTEEAVALTSALYASPYTPGDPALQTCATTPAPDGSWSCTYAVPVPDGSYVLGVSQSLPIGTTDGAFVDLNIDTVLPPPPPPPPTPPAPAPSTPPSPVLQVMSWQLSVTDLAGAPLDADSLLPGQRFVVRGTGLPPSASATIELHSDPVALGAVVAGADGAFALAAQVPAEAQPGAHEVVVLVTAPGYEDSVATHPVTVAPADELGPAAGPGGSEPAEPTAAPTATAGPGWDEPTVLGTSLRTVAELRFDPLALAAVGGVTAGAMLMIALPWVLLESALRENYDRIFGWLAPIRRRLHRIRTALWGTAAARWVTALALTIASAVILGFADPGFPATPASLRLLLALTISIVVLNLTLSAGVAAIARRAFGARSMLLLRPAGLLVLAAGVLVSRLTGLEPGLLFGAFVGVALISSLDRAALGRYALLGAGLTTALGLAAWLGYSAVTPLASAEPGFGVLLLQEVLAALGAESLMVFVVLLLPVTFLDGKAVWDWSKTVWAVSYAIVLAIFALIVLPMPEHWTELGGAGAAGAVMLAVVGALSVGVWAWFRYRPSRSA